MKLYVGVTDNDWYQYLSSQPGIDEVNFWQPGGQRQFSALSAGEPFLFKLHSPENYIVGGGFFGHSSLLPTTLAWEAFEEKNGAVSIGEMRTRIEKYRRAPADPRADYTIGCILLVEPFFFDRKDWIPIPSDFKLQTVQGKTYDATTGTGKALWQSVEELLRRQNSQIVGGQDVADRFLGGRYGAPTTRRPRLGQGTFRVLVTDVYNRRCAVTSERTLPALEAAHIRPYSERGPHRADNGLLLRRDIHRLFDLGYVTVTAEHRFEVSGRIREDFENGRDYYALHGRRILLPQQQDYQPAAEFLAYHSETIFRR